MARTFRLRLGLFDTYLHRLNQRAKQRLAWAETLQFPHRAFRKNQRAMAGQVYNSVRRQENYCWKRSQAAAKPYCAVSRAQSPSSG